MENSKENKIPVDLIARMLSGEADKTELNNLEIWASESDANRKIISQYKNLWLRSGNIIPTREISPNSEWDKFISGRSTSLNKSKESPVIYIFRRIAAAALVIIVLGYGSLFTYNKLRFEKVVAMAEVTVVSLPDGSEVSLYPGSVIKYPKKFKNNIRPVELNGEAFFDVERDTLKTFSVSSGIMSVEVLGTAFNVEAFKKTDVFKVVVEEGKVAVLNNKAEENKQVLVAGEKVMFNLNTKTLTKTVNADRNFNSWRTNNLIFDNSKLHDVAATLSKVFLIEIEVEPSAVMENITVTFNNRSLDYIFNTIEATLDVNIDLEDGRYIIR